MAPPMSSPTDARPARSSASASPTEAPSREARSRRAVAPALSYDGSQVAFAGFASDLLPGLFVNGQQVFVRDRLAGTTELASIDGTGDVFGNGFSQNLSISDDGSLVAFDSGASDLVPGDANSRTDVFVHERGGAPPEPPDVVQLESVGGGIAPAVQSILTRRPGRRDRDP